MPGRGTDAAKPPYEAGSVDRSDLVKHYLPLLALEAAGDSSGVGGALRGHGGDDEGEEVFVHLVWGDDQSRPCLLDLVADGGIQGNQEDIETADYHCHSSRSHSVD